MHFLKKRDVLLSSLFNFAFEYARMKLRENQDGWVLNGTHQLLVYVHDVNKTEATLDVNRDVGLGVSPVIPSPKCRQNQNLMTANEFSKV
jgi:hypothetical protein